MQDPHSIGAMPPLRPAGPVDDAGHVAPSKSHSGLPPWAATIIGFVVGILLVGGGYLLATRGAVEDPPAARPSSSTDSSSSSSGGSDASTEPTPNDESPATAEPSADAPDSDQSADRPDEPTQHDGLPFPTGPGGGTTGGR